MRAISQSREGKDMNKRKTKVKDRLPRISFYPLTPEEAMSALMKVDPKRVRAAEKRAKVKEG
jgi:hypothetical protein